MAYNVTKMPLTDKQAKANKTTTRDYLYSLGKSYGMSETDVDNLIKWDNDTKQVSFGGKNIGTPDAVVDGVSYWSDTSKLDNAFNNYISRTGTVRPKTTAVNQENEDLFKKYRQTYDAVVMANPYDTEEGKTILNKYSLAGLQGRDNEVASGSASNGGNIDSFSAANALRQQAALVNQGQMAVLEAHRQKIESARAMLSDMGVNIDRVFKQDETAQNNDIARKSEMASVTGYVPIEWTLKNDEFLGRFVDENGKLKEEYNSTDFQELINNAKASGNTELANKYAILRGLKIFGNFSEYGKYLNQGDIAYAQRQRTAEYDLTKQKIDSAERISISENETDKEIADKSAALTREQMNNSNDAEVAKAERTAYINGQYDTMMAHFKPNETRKAEFVITYIKPFFEEFKKTGKAPSVSDVIFAITEHTAESNIDVDDAMAICEALGVDTTWLDGWEDDPNDGHGGMVEKEGD